MALAQEKITGKMFRLEIIKAEPDRLKYKVSLIQHDLLNETPVLKCGVAMNTVPWHVGN